MLGIRVTAVNKTEPSHSLQSSQFLNQLIWDYVGNFHWWPLLLKEVLLSVLIGTVLVQGLINRNPCPQSGFLGTVVEVFCETKPPTYS